MIFMKSVNFKFMHDLENENENLAQGTNGDYGKLLKAQEDKKFITAWNCNSRSLWERMRVQLKKSVKAYEHTGIAPDNQIGPNLFRWNHNSEKEETFFFVARKYGRKCRARGNVR